MRGRRQSIDVSSQFVGTPAERQRFGWGDAPSITGAEDLRQFWPQYQPQGGIFSPSVPVAPVEPELARIWDYPVGYNLQYRPRSYEPVSYAELRALASNETLTRLAIETRKDQIEKLDWQIKPRDEKNPRRDADRRIGTLTEMWHRPDGERPFAAWLRETLEDLLVIDAPTFEILRNRDGTVRGYDIVDGATINVLIDHTGRRPTAPAPAYQQVIHGRPWRLFSEDELLYIPRNKRPGHVYGHSPTEQLLMFINIALRRQMSQLYWFTEGNLPQGFLNIPELNPDQVNRLQEYLNSMLRGNLAERSGFQPLPYGAKWQAVKEKPLKDEFDEWLARVIMFCFSLPPDAFVKQRNRSTSETARETALEEGLAPLMNWVKRLVDGEIQRRMGHPDLEFVWQDIRQIDPEIQNKIEVGYVKAGVKTPDEARDAMGLDPYPDGIGANAFIVAGNQIVMVKDIEAASAKTVAPPPPPMIPVAGPQAPGGPRLLTSRAPAGGGGTEVGRGGAGGTGEGARHVTPGGGPAANDRRQDAAITRAAQSRARARPSADGARREALDREARGLLRRHRAARVEGDLRQAGA